MVRTVVSGPDEELRHGKGRGLSKKIRVCKDCIAELQDLGRSPRNPRPAPHPGPRCTTHHRAKKKADSERAAGLRWVANFGLTPDLYRAILAAQGGGCAICGRPPGKRRLAVDHDHSCCPGKTSCGKCIRGLLDWSCNKFLEHLKDSPVAAARMLNYLTHPPAQQILREAP